MYMLGATVLMVLGSERLLLIVLAPGVLGSAAFLALGRPHYLEYAAWGALAATPALALALATWRAGREPGFFGQRRSSTNAQTQEPAGQLITAAELRGALPSAGFGLVVAGLLVFPVAAGLAGRQGANTGALIASLPLALSMGVAEWTLVWFRRRTQRLLRATRDVRAFAHRARLTLLIALLQYLTAAALKSATDPLVMVGAAAAFTVMVSASVAVLPEELVAEMVTLKVPAVPLAGVPPMVAVPFLLSVNVSPLGRVPDSVIVGVGEPVVVTV
jgi:hypothetical protein